MEREKDEELISRSRKGDERAMEELMRRYAYLVRSCARQYFLVGGETEDLLQEGMIGLYRAVNDYDGTLEKASSFKNFARLCITRQILDAVRSVYRKKNAFAQSLQLLDAQMAEQGLSPEELVIVDDERTELRQKMGKVLSDFEFKVLTMYVDGSTCAEICEATGKPPKSVDNAVQRGRRKLLEEFKR